MEQLITLSEAILTGFVFGIIVCIPVGPINLTIINEGARNGFKWAALIGIGATLMEVIYCGIAFTGFAGFFEKGWIKYAMEVFSFFFLLTLGIKYLTAKTLHEPSPLGLASEKIEKRLHPHSAFMIGFVRTLANPGVLLGWIVMGSIFINHRWVEPNWNGKFACMFGVAAGVGLWFIGLSWAISLGHRKITEGTLLKMERGSGIGLLVLGLIQGAHIVWQLSKHKG